MTGDLHSNSSCSFEVSQELRDRARSEIAAALGRTLRRHELQVVDGLLADAGLHSSLALLEQAKSPADLELVLAIARVLDRLVPDLDAR